MASIAKCGLSAKACKRRSFSSVVCGVERHIPASFTSSAAHSTPFIKLRDRMTSSSWRTHSSLPEFFGKYKIRSASARFWAECSMAASGAVGSADIGGAVGSQGAGGADGGGSTVALGVAPGVATGVAGRLHCPRLHELDTMPMLLVCFFWEQSLRFSLLLYKTTPLMNHWYTV